MNPRQIIDKLKVAEQPVLVASSAGSDSMVLLDALHRNAIDVVACYVDHQQRPSENEQEKQLLSDYCAERDIQFFIQAIDLSEYDASENKQAFFRERRYALLTEQAEALGIPTIATAHHQDDQAETQLMRLIKNYDVMSYTGILPVQQLTEEIQLIRPMLDVRKAEILAYCEAFDVPYLDDSSNTSRAYFRNRVRLETMPVFEAENEDFVPDFIEKMGDFVSYQQYLQRELEGALLAKLPLTNVVEQTDFVNFLATYDESLQKLIIPVLLQKFLGYDGKIKQEKIKEIIKCLFSHPRKTAIMLDGNTSFGIQYGKMFIIREGIVEPEDLSMKLTLGENIIAGYHVVCALEEAEASDPWKTIVLSRKAFEKGVYLRYPEDEDYLPLKKGKKKLNRLYIDEKVLPNVRFKLPILVTEAHEVVYDVATGKVGCCSLPLKKGENPEPSVYLHIKKRI